ncbi:lipoyl protein ligase domain-containing protein [Sinomonas terrae]|uniref:Lipoate--protein ligase family protein n=1 Tax=Sinomonas terrae TaxID=2908838 RepID=A0ABS9U7U1_9MICC|nr:lipoate--protein ligase family protein [Sinomonas terrae]MCH6472601.1 lipoate--protein ligase family protein [Sinomonas terrae]
MSEEAFGSGPVALVQDGRPRAGRADMELVHSGLASLARGARGELNVARPAPTAAFSRRDSMLDGHPVAQAWLESKGFAPIIRPVGGHLAVYGPGDLVIHLWAPHPEARSHIRHRFRLFGEALARSLQGLGVDAQVGPVPGEYCTGEFSVNDSGRTKLAGTGQRITKHGYLFSAVVMVEDASPARSVLGEAYGMLGLDFREESVGCVADSAPGATVGDLREAVVDELSRILPLGSNSALPSDFPDRYREAEPAAGRLAAASGGRNAP